MSRADPYSSHYSSFFVFFGPLFFDRKEIRKFVRRFSITATTGLAIAAIYLAYWGVIGFQSWK
jgi:hypothetical protein